MKYMALFLSFAISAYAGLPAVPCVDVNSFDINLGGRSDQTAYLQMDRPNLAIKGLYQPTSEDMAYNHHCVAGLVGSTIYGLFSTGAVNGEDNTGQYVRYVCSTNGGFSFTSPAVLIPALTNYQPGIDGYGIYPNEIINLLGKSFLVAGVRWGDGKTDYTKNAVMAVQLNEDGTHENPEWIINPQVLSSTNFNSASQAMIAAISNYYSRADSQAIWQFTTNSFMSPSLQTLGGSDLAEPSSVRFGDYVIQLWRNLSTGNFNIVRAADHGVFGPARVSSTPDPTGGSVRRLHWLKNGNLGMMGNADDGRVGLYFSQARWQVVSSTDWHMSTPRPCLVAIGSVVELYNARVGGKGGGCAYGDFVQINTNTIFGIYSRQKEGIEGVFFNLDGTTNGLPYDVESISDLSPSRWMIASSISAFNGDTITNWTDSSGNGNNLFGTATYYESGRNGQPYVDFNGSTQYMTGGQVVSGKSARTIIFVALADSSDSGAIYAGTDATTTSTNVFNIRANVMLDIGGSSAQRTNTPFTSIQLTSFCAPQNGWLVEPTGTNNWQSIEYKANGVTYSLNTRTNANVKYDTSTGSMRIGRDNGGNYFNGRIYELIEWNRRLNRTELMQAFAILEKRYNIPIFYCNKVPE